MNIICIVLRDFKNTYQLIHLKIDVNSAIAKVHGNMQYYALKLV